MSHAIHVVSEEFKRRIAGFGISSVQIWYTKPGHPTIVNPHWLLWQQEDVAPKFPRLLAFLNRWQNSPEFDSRPLFVKVAHSNLIAPQEFEFANGEFRLN